MNYDPIIHGASGDRNIVAVELAEQKHGREEIVTFHRDGSGVAAATGPFTPFIVAAGSCAGGCPGVVKTERLNGSAPLDRLLFFESWKDCVKAKAWFSAETGQGAGTLSAPYLFMGDPVHQHMLLSGKTLFLGMEFSDVRRMQVDIECRTSPGYEFCNAEREGDCIIAIALSDNTGWSQVLSLDRLSEKDMLKSFVKAVLARDPDIIEGHNVFNFDLPYMMRRAKMHGVKLAIGRDGSVPRHRPSRLFIAERTIAYERFDIFGRHVVDTLFLVHAYDVSHRSLSGFGLKEAAKHFNVAPPGRTYMPGEAVSAEFDRDPGRVLKYVSDDAYETRELSNILSRSSFIQAQMLPYSFQNVCVRGNATRIDSLFVREYLRQRHSLPFPGRSQDFAGGYTDIFITGVVSDVHHCDVRSLYPSLMLAEKIAPAGDDLGVFLRILAVLRDFRLEAKKLAAESRTDSAKLHMEALQSAFKVLINSFYGYLGFAQGRFCDFDAAAKVTARGRELLAGMIRWLGENGARPVEIDTDGIYFVPPRGSAGSGCARNAFRSGLEKSLPPGIEIEFDGEYRSMFSYKMKNYALLAEDGEIIIRGAALKSRGLEPFQRDFMVELLRFRLEGKEKEIPRLKTRYEDAIRGRKLDIKDLAKTDILQDSIAVYKTKIGKNSRNRSAAYELAIASGREYRPGDQISYYITGDRKNVRVFEAAKIVSAWNPASRDENIPYYLAKLEALYEKFMEKEGHPELALDGG